jgi:cation-transporting ATPase E
VIEAAATLPLRIPDRGLDDAAVAERIARGAVNAASRRHSRTYTEILRANLLTRFNALLGLLWIAALAIGPLQDTAFGLVLLSNTVIGVVQEVRAKRTLDRLAVLTAPRVTVRRNGETRAIEVSAVVVDDLIELQRGDQLPVDGTVTAAHGLEVDESLLTGESDAVPKCPGDDVLSGSFVVAGGGTYRATRVGADAYARVLTDRARVFAMVRSELRDGINLLLRLISWVIPLVATLLVITQLRANDDPRDAARGVVAGLVALVPEGLVLLTSLAFAVAVVRLGRRNALVQELPAVEMLARVDVVCLDKTGTLTEGDIRVDSVEVLRDGAPAAQALAMLAASDPSPNASLAAIGRAYPPAPAAGWRVTGTVPFSSARRWSGVAVAGQGAFVLGAPEVLLGAGGDDHATVMRCVEAHAAEGRRTVVLCECATLQTAAAALPAQLVPIAVLALAEKVRDDAQDTVRYFLDQGVAVKVISGDNPHTVAAIARRAGVPGADHAVDGRDLPGDMDALANRVESENVFGRVAPQQKRAMVAALQSRGHVVAMTGDGVNDVLALKDADIGIAMGSGSGASRAVAQLVLLDGRFATLPVAVAEGRRVVANVERVGNLFLTKTAYAMTLAIAVGIASLPFPLLSRHLTLIAALTVGTPGFFLALAPTAQRARRGFVARILRFAMPAGVAMAVATFFAYWLALDEPGTSLDAARTTAAITLLLGGLWLVLVIARPLTAWKRGLVAAMFGAFLVVLATPPLRTLFGIVLPTPLVWLAALGIATLLVAALELGWRGVDRVVRAFDRTPTGGPGEGCSTAAPGARGGAGGPAGG